MNRRHELQTRKAFVLTFCAMLISASATASDRRDYTEEFHQTYALAADGRVELENINGDVHISTWDRNEIKVDAVKYAGTKERLDEARIEVNSGKDSISIKTQYPDHDHTFNWGSRNNPAGVEYTLTVPRSARLDELSLVNGGLDIKDVAGEVHASCVNGRLEAHNLSGRAELSTVNGRLNVTFGEMPTSSIKLESVNGGLDLTIPSDARGEIEASTVNGRIENDFGLHVNHPHYGPGHSLRGELGSGGAHIKLENVNGHIEIRRASDGRALSPVKDLSHRDKDDDDDNDI
jgi:hypothetical protein